VCPSGHLPAGSVETEADAEELIARCCERVIVTEEHREAWMAQELHDEQTLENLYKFGARLEAEYQKMLAERANKT
jgi:hypothetical protein